MIRLLLPFPLICSLFPCVLPFSPQRIFFGVHMNMKSSPTEVLQLHTFSNDFNTPCSKKIDPSDLLVMDVVLYSRQISDDMQNKLEIGAVQEDGCLQPLTAWTHDGAFQNSGDDYMELLVDHDNKESFSVHHPDTITIHSVLDAASVSYGSRQVGGGKGPGNPHGEESELLYYVKKSLLEEKNVTITINPALEIRW